MNIEELLFDGIFIDYKMPTSWLSTPNLTAMEQLEALIHQYGLENLQKFHFVQEEE